MERGNIISAAGSLAAMLVGTVFALLYTELKMKSFCADRVVALSYPCLLFHRLTLPALLMPAVFAAAFALLIKRQKFNQHTTAIFVTASNLFTLSWVLICLLVWELPSLPFCGQL